MKDNSLPYVYLDEDDDGRELRKKKKTGTKPSKTASGSANVKRSANAAVHSSSGSRKPKKSAQKKKKESSTALIIIVLCAFLLVMIGGVAALEYFRITDLGLREYIFGAGVTSATPTTGTHAGYVSASDSASTVSWFTPEDNADDTLNQAEGHSISVTPEQLSVTEGLSEDWLNMLLLGTDSRALNEPSRSDTMMICSVNRRTGQVKLTSLMRDTAVEINGRTVKLNNAYFLGGPNLAMKTVNENFGMNIEKYVVVNFSGFAKIVDALGGVDMDVSEAELPLLNHNVGEQYYLLFKFGEMEEEAAKAKYQASQLPSAGKSIHLDGNQALAYARIRKSDNDYTRTERQRKVLMVLLNKMKGTDATTIMNLIMNNIEYVQTNLALGDCVNLAAQVLSGSGMTNNDTLRLPVQGSYREEVRNNVSMLYDVKLEENKRALFMFIYGN